MIDALLNARVYDLEQPRYAGIPIHPAHEPGVSLTLHRRHERDAAESRTGASALLVMAEHTGTHIDALCHQAYDGVMHGGVAATPSVQTPTGFTQLGIDTVEPIVRVHNIRPSVHSFILARTKLLTNSPAQKAQIDASTMRGTWPNTLS